MLMFALGFLAGFVFAALLAWALLVAFLRGEWLSNEIELTETE